MRGLKVAETIKVELVSPEKMVASMEAEMVGLPGSDGDFAAMSGHTPTATTLRPGIITIRSGSETKEFLIAGGFAEVTADSVSILAEYAANRDEADREKFQTQLDAITAKMEASEGLRKADAERDGHEVRHLLDNLVPK